MAYSVYSYLGFGDHCTCYGLIKEFAKHHDKILYYSDKMTKQSYDNSVTLYKTIPNVELIPDPVIPNETHIDWPIANTTEWFIKTEPWEKNPDLPLTDEIKNNLSYWRCESHWYINAGIPFNLKWDNFYLERDLNKEKEVYYDRLGLKDNEKFAFIHEDITRGGEYHPDGYKMNKEYVNVNIRHIEMMNMQDINILHLVYTLERAFEIHSFNSGIAIFIDLVLKNHNNLYYHDYMRRKIFWRPTFKLNWTEIKSRIKL